MSLWDMEQISLKQTKSSISQSAISILVGSCDEAEVTFNDSTIIMSVNALFRVADKGGRQTVYKRIFNT
jgi:hypothetical protein